MLAPPGPDDTLPPMILSYLIALFIFMPLLELAVLFKIHGLFGPLPTLALVIVTGFIGAFLARMEGLRVVRDIQRDLAEGRMPAPRMIDGVMILAAGILMITPGLITDTAGFLLLLPGVRVAIRAWLRRKFEQKLRDGTITMTWR